MIPGYIGPLTDAHAHGIPGEADLQSSIIRLWNVELQSASLPAPSHGFSAGIHPANADDFNWNDLSSLIKSDRCFAVGECGLDRRTSKANLMRQTEVFLQHVSLAEESNKPLLIHCVRCTEELIRLKKGIHNDHVVWIMHGFRGKERKAMELLNAGFILSFGVGLLRDAGNMDYFGKIPIDHILMESDESPELLEQIYVMAASLHKDAPASFAAAVTKNFFRIFQYGKVNSFG